MEQPPEQAKVETKLGISKHAAVAIPSEKHLTPEPGFPAIRRTRPRWVAMRQRCLRKYIKALEDIKGRKKPLQRDQLHQALGAATKEAGRDARHLTVSVCLGGKGEAQTATLTYELNKTTLRVARRREGGIFCVPISRTRTRQNCGSFTCSSMRWSRRLRNSKVSWHCGRFTINSRDVLSRYTQPEREVSLLLEHLKLTLPEQASPKIYSPDKDSNLKAV